MTKNIKPDELTPLIIACVEDHPKAIALLRIANRRAREKQCKWRAVFIETPTDAQQVEEAPRERILRLLTLAEQMGGEAVHIEAESLEKGLEAMLQKEKLHLALVMLGSIDAENRWLKLSNPNWMRAARIASHYAPVEIVPLHGQVYRHHLLDRLRKIKLRPIDAGYALLTVGVACLCAFFLQWALPPALFRINDQNVALLFMIACAFVAGRFGLMPGLVAALGSFLTVNYFFTLPYYVLKVNTITDTLNMALFLSAAVLIAVFTSQTRAYAQKAAQRERSTQALFTLYRIASEAHSREQALKTLHQRLEYMLEVDVAFFMPPILQPSAIEAVYPMNLVLQEADKKALNNCWNDMKTTGLGSPSGNGTTWRFEPMISSAGEIGVLGIRPRGQTQLDAWFGRLLAAIADQTAAVLQHISLERSMEETRLREEREKLRTMLLSSVSHDLKTPLAGIIGALSVYRSMHQQISSAKREELIETAIEEAQRLDTFISNILDMTRLETGNIQFRKEWHDIDELIENVVRRMEPRCKQHKLKIHPAPNGVEVCVDMLMTEQVLQNIIDNACKYTPPGTDMELRSYIEEGKGLICQLRDFGEGIPVEKLDSIFDKYTRLEKQDSQVAGTGLGLAIAKTVMAAQDGWITASNHPEGGALFTLCFTKWRSTAQPSNPQKDHAHAALESTHCSH